MADKRNDDDIEVPERGYTTSDVRAQDEPETKRKRRRPWWLIVPVTLVLIPGLIFALWSWITLSYAYSSGERAGYVQKFSKKGWLCKTWEGELAMATLPGAMPELFRFTVRDDAVAQRIEKAMGRRVSLHYDQHRGVPTTCFGETQYFVKEMREVAPS